MPTTLTGAAAFLATFNNATIAQAVNVLPNTYGLMRDLGFAPVRGVADNLVRVDFYDEGVVVLPSVARGAPATEAKRGTDQAFFIELPSFPHKDTLTPDDVQSLVRIINGQLRTESVAEALERLILRPIRRKHDLTLEWLRLGALQGKITDGAGVTLHDLYDKFGKTRTEIDFVLGTETTNVEDKCAQLYETMAENLKGETMTHPRVIVSKEFFSKFVAHKQVRESFLNWQAATALSTPDRQVRGNQHGRVFSFGNIEWIEYLGSAPLATGSSARMVAAGKGHAYPVGTSAEAHVTYAGPPYDIRQVNQPGGEIHVSMKELDHGEGIEVKTEACPLPIFARIEALIGVTTSN